MDAIDLDADPLRQLATWLDAARAAGQPMPEAMTIASATSDPSGFDTNPTMRQQQARPEETLGKGGDGLGLRAACSWVSSRTGSLRPVSVTMTVTRTGHETGIASRATCLRLAGLGVRAASVRHRQRRCGRLVDRAINPCGPAIRGVPSLRQSGTSVSAEVETVWYGPPRLLTADMARSGSSSTVVATLQ